MVARGWFLSVGTQTGAQWLVLRILVALISSVVGLLIRMCCVSDSFHGGLSRMFTSFRVVLNLNNSLVCHVQPASCIAL